MAQVDAQEVADRLVDEQRDLWIHIDSSTPMEKYPAKQHAQSVAESLDVKEGLIYLPGAPTTFLEDSDQPVSFRQRRYFYYLSGVDEPGCHLLYNIDKDTLTLFIPKFDTRQVVWYGRGSNREEARQKYDVDKVKWANKLSKKIKKALKQTKGKLYILHPSQEPLGYKTNDPRINFSDLQDAIDRCRVIKDPHEIKLIRKANEISAKAHSAVLEAVLGFKNEADVEAIFREKSIAHGPKHQAYHVIAASGTNAAILHYGKNDEPLAGRQLLVLDAGAEYSCYASDITRTIPLGIPGPGGVDKWPSEEAAEIYSLVSRMQIECIKRLKPGIAFRDLHILAHAILIRGFLKLGIFTGSEEDIMKQGVSAAFFPHGLGHHLGLEVHDVIGIPIWLQKSLPLVDQSTNGASGSLFTEAGFPYLCDTSKTSAISDIKTFAVDPPAPARGLLEGMVITIEPGIYFNAYALEKVYFPSPIYSKYINKEVLKRYMPVGGVRIEDDILITHNGYENLTTAPKLAPASPFDITVMPYAPQVSSRQKVFSSDGQCSDATPRVRSSVPTQPTEDKCSAHMKVDALPELNEHIGQEKALREKLNELEARYKTLIRASKYRAAKKSVKPNAKVCSCKHGQLDAKFDKLMEKFRALPPQSSGTDWMCVDEFYDAFAAMKFSIPRKWRAAFDTHGSEKSLCDAVWEEMETLYERMEERYKKVQSTLEAAPEQKMLSPMPRKRAAETTLPIRTRDVKRGKTLFEEWKASREDGVDNGERVNATLWQKSLFQKAPDSNLHIPSSTTVPESSFDAAGQGSHRSLKDSETREKCRASVLSDEEKKPYEKSAPKARERYGANKEDYASRGSNDLSAKLKLPPPPSLKRHSIPRVGPSSVSAGSLAPQQPSKSSSEDSRQSRSSLVMVQSPCYQCKLDGQSCCGYGRSRTERCLYCERTQPICLRRLPWICSACALDGSQFPCGPSPHRLPGDIPPPPGALSPGAIPLPPLGVPPTPGPVFAPPPPPGIQFNHVPFYAPLPQPLPHLTGYPPPFPSPPSVHFGPIPPPKFPPPAASAPADEDSWDVMGCNDCSARGMKCELDHFNDIKSPQHSLHPHPPLLPPHLRTPPQPRPNVNNPAPLGHRTNPAARAQPSNPFSWQIPTASLSSPTLTQPHPEMLGRLTSPFPMPAVAKPSINGRLPSLKEGLSVLDPKPKSPDHMLRAEHPWVPWLKSERGSGLESGRDGSGESELGSERRKGPRVPEKPEAYRWSLG